MPESRKNNVFESAALTIQKFARGYLTRKGLDKKKNTAQSVKKQMLIPPLKIHKINSSEASQNPYVDHSSKQKALDNLQSSSRSNSIFDHHSFQQISANRQ